MAVRRTRQPGGRPRSSLRRRPSCRAPRVPRRTRRRSPRRRGGFDQSFFAGTTSTCPCSRSGGADPTPGSRANRFGRRAGSFARIRGSTPASRRTPATHSTHSRSFPGGFVVSNRTSRRSSSAGGGRLHRDWPRDRPAPDGRASLLRIVPRPGNDVLGVLDDLAVVEDEHRHEAFAGQAPDLLAAARRCRPGSRRPRPAWVRLQWPTVTALRPLRGGPRSTLGAPAGAPNGSHPVTRPGTPVWPCTA